MSPRRPRLGLRREVLILLPAAVLVLAGLATFTLLAYRGSVSQEIAERRASALQLARALAERLAAEPRAAEEVLREAAPGALAAAIVDLRGVARQSRGPLPDRDLFAPLAGRAPLAATAVGPSGEEPRIAAFAPFVAGGERRVVRLDFAADSLANQERTLAVLVPVVLGVGVALSLLVVFFLRHLLAPYDTLVRRAREAGLLAPETAASDEIAGLVASFERAVAERAAAGPAGALAAVERDLAPELESGLLLFDDRGLLLAVNPAGAELLGLPRDAAGRPLGEALAAHPALVAALTPALAAARGIEREEVAVTVDGRSLALGLAAHVLRRPSGEARGLLVLFNDATRFQRLAAERRLAASLMELGELAAGVAHELRNSVATLKGYLELSERNPAEASDYRREIAAETARLGRVVDDFLAFARPDRERLGEVDLTALLASVAREAILAGGRVESNLPEHPVRLAGDPELLRRAVINLMRNAEEAQAATGTEAAIELALRVGAEGWQLTVADRGPGIPPALRERLFRPFVSSKPGGVGLGLALAHRLFALHGAVLRLDSRPGGGCLAIASFPIDAVVTYSNRKGLDPRP